MGAPTETDYKFFKNSELGYRGVFPQDPKELVLGEIFRVSPSEVVAASCDKGSCSIRIEQGSLTFSEEVMQEVVFNAGAENPSQLIGRNALLFSFNGQNGIEGIQILAPNPQAA